jgi:hypothetical protein
MMRGFSLLVVRSQWSEVSGQLSVVSCQKSVVNSPVVSSQLSVAS